MTRKWLKAGLIGCGLVGAVAWSHRRKRRDFVWSVGDSLSNIVKAHAEYLLVKHPTYYDKFQRLRDADLEAAMGEAAVFSMLKTYFRAEPEPADEPGTGGVDFICRKDKDDAFVVEVTSLKPESVAKKSGIPVTVDEGGGAFEMTTRQLFFTVCGKADQLADYPCPRVLAITSTHFASSFLLGAQGAEYLLTSEPKLTFSAGAPGAPLRMTTDLRSAAFFAPGANGQVVPRRQTVSAVLLIGLFGDQSNVIGLLHPAPARPLSTERFREVPFLRMRNWPIVAGAINTEWVVSSPEAKSFPHSAITLSHLDVLRTH
jgi:hypothetical protein